MGILFNLLGQLTQLYMLLIFVRVIITWIPNIDPYHPMVQMLHQLTDPVLEPVRRIIPPLGMVDISPFVVILALNILSNLLMSMG